MSIQHTRKPFGEYTLCTIGDEDTYVSFVPEKSGYVHQIRLKGRDLLWNYPSGPELTDNNGYRNIALLPFPNRLSEGRYDWNSQSFAFDVNDPGNNSALHGFGPTSPFSIERYDFSKHKATVKLTCLNRKNGHTAGYPFLLKFDLILKVDLYAHTVEWQLSATNLGAESAPVGLGWHPYFLLPGGHGQWEIQFPPNEHVVLENAFTTGVRKVGLSPKQPAAINADWDDCFALTDPKSREIQLLGPNYSLSLKQTGSTLYTQMYVPGEGHCIAIEPVTCGVDAFNVSKDEVELLPGQSITAGMVISQI